MPRCNGSYLGHTPSPNSNVASGIWTVREAESYLRADKWPATPTVPGAPTGTAGDGQVALTWTAPTGGSTPTDYEVQYSSNGGSSWTTFSDGVSTSTSATVTGLTNGTGYIFRVRALNSLGEGPYGSASGTLTPTALPISILLRFNGTNGSTTFTNDGSFPLSLSAVFGSPSISTAKSKFGGSSLYANSGQVGQNGLNYDDIDDTVDFTVETWVWWPTGGGNTTIFGLGKLNSPGFHFWINGSGVVHVDNFQAGQLVTTGTVPREQWVHIAVVRKDGDYTVYIDGVSAGTAANVGPGAGPFDDIFIGGWFSGGFVSNSYFDDLRVTSSAVYTSNFTPPTAPF